MKSYILILIRGYLSNAREIYCGVVDKLRILFISDVPLNKENSTGNTLINLFQDMKGADLFSLFTRSGSPDEEIHGAFCITEKMIINNFLTNTHVGEVVSSAKNSTKETLGELRIINFIKARRWTVFFWLQGLIWKVGRWKSTELKKFISEQEPDIIFVPFSNFVFLNNLICYILSISKAKLAVYAWDNNYSLRTVIISPLRWVKHLRERSVMRKLASKADLFYVISEVQKKDYENAFEKKCKLLTKGADFSVIPDLKTDSNDPLQLVFTGNIGLNRWKSLKVIADALENINCAGIKLQLRIYTATPVTKKMERALNRGESSFLMGSVPASRVPELQKEADILVHVEAFDLKNKLTVRQSFSTKIVDYLKAARPILAVGPKDVASIDHLIKNNCAIVADNRRELEEKLRSVIADKTKLRAIARNGYACGRRYHNKQDIQTMLMNDLNAICGK